MSLTTPKNPADAYKHTTFAIKVATGVDFREALPSLEAASETMTYIAERSTYKNHNPKLIGNILRRAATCALVSAYEVEGNTPRLFGQFIRVFNPKPIRAFEDIKERKLFYKRSDFSDLPGALEFKRARADGERIIPACVEFTPEELEALTTQEQVTAFMATYLDVLESFGVVAEKKRRV